MKINNKILSPLALGTAPYGSGIGETDAFALIDVYRDAGGNILDTARVYGESENTIGRYLRSRGCRHETIISTKGGHYDVQTKEKRVNRHEIYADVEISLKNLGTDYVDIYWLHRDDEDVPVEEIMTILSDLTKEGKILSIGVSNWTPQRIEKANSFVAEHSLQKIVASQIKHSAAISVTMSDPTMLSLTDASRPFYAKQKMPIFAYTPQARGLFSKLETSGESGISEWLSREFLCEENLRRYMEIKSLSQQLDRPVNQVALALLLCDTELDIIPIIGAKTQSQLIDSLAATDIILTPSQIAKVMKGPQK